MVRLLVSVSLCNDRKVIKVTGEEAHCRDIVKQCVDYSDDLAQWVMANEELLPSKPGVYIMECDYILESAQFHDETILWKVLLIKEVVEINIGVEKEAMSDVA